MTGQRAKLSSLQFQFTLEQLADVIVSKRCKYVKRSIKSIHLFHSLYTINNVFLCGGESDTVSYFIVETQYTRQSVILELFSEIHHSKY